eukprot:CAMPEP_0182460030 /NCGR_PEP_ID=MMETSP1319-20130603/5011_1 /TAXON_ID=172717 /ORGANISM="Bolidomonas pacifica, Strain RCC208" /LENGTH=208 /DNA_ID=CAMNT_0024659065 /DNA_START=313 /DNA_END=936 /DNA_ORIENTATION=+
MNPVPRIRNCYKLLSIAPHASQPEVKAAYRKLALLWHPDKNPDDASAEARFKDLQEAYDVLSDGKRRKEHDREIGLHDRVRPGMHGSPFAGGGGGGGKGKTSWNFNAGARNKGYDAHAHANSTNYRPSGPPKWGGPGFNSNVHGHMHYGDEIRSASGKVSGGPREPERDGSSAFRNVDLGAPGIQYVGKSERKEDVRRFALSVHVTSL